MNGDTSLAGPRSRRGGSKSRVLSPPPQPPTTSNAHQNSASTSDVTNEVIKEEIEPVVPLENGVQNGHQNGHQSPANEEFDQLLGTKISASTPLTVPARNKR